MYLYGFSSVFQGGQSFSFPSVLFLLSHMFRNPCTPHPIVSLLFRSICTHYVPPSCLMSCLAQNYKVPVSCNYSAVCILKSSGSIPCTIKTHPHSDSCLLYLDLSLSLLSQTSASLNPKPTSEIPGL